MVSILPSKICCKSCLHATAGYTVPTAVHMNKHVVGILIQLTEWFLLIPSPFLPPLHSPLPSHSLPFPLLPPCLPLPLPPPPSFSSSCSRLMLWCSTTPTYWTPRLPRWSPRSSRRKLWSSLMKHTTSVGKIQPIPCSSLL